MQFRSRAIRLKLGLQTVLGMKRRGFFIPYSRAENVAGYEHHSYCWIRHLFDEHRQIFTALLDEIEANRAALLAISGLEPPLPRFEQDWFPRLDAVAHYTMVRSRKPRRIIEVGSGHSTRFICRAVADGALQTRVTAIDPQPRADIAELPVRLLRASLQDVELGVFDEIAPGDFVCVDSSHILMPGTDVDVMINHVLPMLPAGCFVFFHDIFLPDAYPRDWAPTGYNEQNAVAILLQGQYEPVFASAYAVRHMADAVNATVLADIPLHPGGIENGLWLRKT